MVVESCKSETASVVVVFSTLVSQGDMLQFASRYSLAYGGIAGDREPSLRSMVDSDGAVERIGVIPFSTPTKRMLRYHSLSISKGLSPLAVGWSAKVLKSATQCGFTDQLSSKYPPIQASMPLPDGPVLTWTV